MTQLMPTRESRPVSMLLHAQLRRLIVRHYSLDDIRVEVLRLKEIYNADELHDALLHTGTEPSPMEVG